MISRLFISTCAAVSLLLSACTARPPAEETPSDAAAIEQSSLPLQYPSWKTNRPGERQAYNQRVSLIQRGHVVYRKYCVGCHGENGDGKGPASVRLLTQPRDFTSGVYKFRTTDSGSLPMEVDLHRTISRGLARVSMPAFPLMPEREKVAVIEYIKGFYPRWADEKDQRQIVPVPRAPRDLDSSERISRGRVVYIDMQCWKCHGVDGQGEGATQTEYVDAWGNEQRPFNFTRGSLKGGDDPEDIYRTFHTGLRSIMPSYGGDTLAATTSGSFRTNADVLGEGELARLEPVLDTFPETGEEVFGGGMTESERMDLARRNSWDLVAYVMSLRQVTTTADAVLGANRLEER